MRYRFWIGFGSLALLSLVGWVPEGGAQMQQKAITGDSGTLTVDVIPLQAEIRLNGVPLGTGHDLVARAISVLPGRNVLQVSAPGYISSIVNVVAPADWASRVWLQLVPDRGR